MREKENTMSETFRGEWKNELEFRHAYEVEFKIRKITLVVAGNYRQYMMYLRESRTAREDALYVHRPDQILGLHKEYVENIVYRGEFWLNPLYGNDELETLKAELE